MRPRSLRFRLTLWYAAVLTAALALFGCLLYVSLRHQLEAGLESDLAGRANRFESFFRSESAEAGAHLQDELEEFCQALTPGSYIQVVGSKGFVFRFPPGVLSGSVPLKMQKHTFTLNGEVLDLEVGAPIGDMLNFLKLLRWLLWSLIPVVIAIASIGGIWLSGRVLKPVRDVTSAALNISIENLSGRLPVPETADEIAQLASVLNSMLARLEAAVASLSQFTGDASHELRTPLTVIRTTAELALRRERSPEAYRAALAQVAGESERMTQLIEDLLTLARSDAAAVEMPRAVLDLREVMAAVSAEMENLADASQVRLTTKFEQQPAFVSANRQALHRLFMVLLDNAIKNSHSGGSVILALKAGRGSVYASVEDFGQGIAAADLPHIFKRFYQADPARAAGGHGLGLSLAEKIAKGHGVVIEVRSTPGKGSLFQVVFPAREAAGLGAKMVADAEALASS